MMRATAAKPMVHDARVQRRPHAPQTVCIPPVLSQTEFPRCTYLVVKSNRDGSADRWRGDDR
jgi:hypothetical protein